MNVYIAAIYSQSNYFVNAKIAKPEKHHDDIKQNSSSLTAEFHELDLAIN